MRRLININQQTLLMPLLIHDLRDFSKQTWNTYFLHHAYVLVNCLYVKYDRILNS